MSGIYIHIPFCRQACNYCDFHFSTSLGVVGSMIESIRKELILRKTYLGDDIIQTIYFGGGTPSFIDAKYIESIIETIHEHYNVEKNAEVTLEANPDDLTLKKNEELISAGVNRLSIGIQSFSDEELTFMNRAHNSKQSLAAVMDAQKAGFSNISIDLIYGLPGSEESQWEKNIDIAMNLRVDHLSCYALTVEPRTLLADLIRKNKISSPDEAKAVSDFELLMKRAAVEGFEHYEISNFARNKKYSMHNTSYWQREKYLGVGPSAHSFNGYSRQWNISNNHLYIKPVSDNIIPSEAEQLTEQNKFNEYILTSLRTMWGVDVTVIEKEFGILRRKEFENKISRYIQEGMVSFSGDTFVLTKKGKFFADRIASELFA